METIPTFGEFTEDETTKTLNKYKAFFAFNNEQFNEQKEEGVKYYSMGMGLILPKDNAKDFIAEMEKNHKHKKKKYLERYSRESIIKMELDNHEGNYEDTCKCLKSLGIKKEEVLNIWQK